MSSTAAGNKLESEIFTLFENEISAGRFFAKPDCCKVFKKKGYYSKDREKEIIFDISIEIYLPGSSSFSILCIIECKNYSHPVPVDDAEEFFAKIQQISGANIKGIIVSKNSFQDGTLKYSQSKGIGLLRYFNSRDFKWILHRSPSIMHSAIGIYSNLFEIYKGLTVISHQSQYFDFYCCGSTYTNSLRVFFLDLIRRSAVSETTVKQIEHLLPVQQPTVEFIAHELGHYFLGHSKYMAGEFCETSDFELDCRIDLETSDIQRMEWQANYFASCLLLPKNVFMHDFSALIRDNDLKDRGFGALFVDKQKCNQKNFYSITNELRYKYRVSRSVITVRLESLGLLADTRSWLESPQSFRNPLAQFTQ